MIYLIGGAPRAGKSILGQRLCATLKVGWVSTDLLMELLRVAKRFGYAYVDMVSDFSQRLAEAEMVLTTGV